MSIKKLTCHNHFKWKANYKEENNATKKFQGMIALSRLFEVQIHTAKQKQITSIKLNIMHFTHYVRSQPTYLSSVDKGSLSCIQKQNRVGYLHV